MGRSKFIYGGEVLLDLTADTVEPGKVLLGFKYHGSDGELHTGTCEFDLDTSGATVKASEILFGNHDASGKRAQGRKRGRAGAASVCKRRL